MGSMNYYKRFVPKLSQAQKAFSMVLKNNRFNWGSLQDQAFKFAKEAIAGEIKLFHKRDTEQVRLCIEFDNQTYACCAY